MDTETLLGLLSSLLESPVSNQSILIDALADSNGDAEAAAQSINSRAKEITSKSDARQGKKRRRAPDLVDWLKPPKSARQDHDEDVRTPMPNASTSGPLTSPRVTKVVDLMTVLRQPSPTIESIPRLPPLTLSNPSLVAQHTPCTLHLSILPPELACRLFYTMLDASRQWPRNRWWLFDRMVESPHRTSFFARNTDALDLDSEDAQLWYNGRRTASPSIFPPEMEEACDIIERIVNDQIRKRERFPLEWGGEDSDGRIWRANFAASNCYEGGKEGVGFHTDKLTHLGPYPTIASLSLGTRRLFSLREIIPSDEASSRRARTFNVPLPHNSLIIMHASTQEKFKHTVPTQSTIDLFRPLSSRKPGELIEPSNCRINITFRFYRPDFQPSSVPRCKCGIPTILRPDMKNRQDGRTDRYWWTCCAGEQNEGKGCGLWKVMDMKLEGRGPVVGSLDSPSSHQPCEATGS